MPKTPRNPHIQYLWPTPILTKKFGQYQKVNRELLELFYTHRNKYENEKTSGYASRDNLYELYKDHAALNQLIKFIMDSVFEVAREVNSKFWGQVQNIDVEVGGIWFQMSNDYAFHQTHVHANCSWSGVYYVQTDECTCSAEDKEYGLLNGITRFYGPYMEAFGGGYVDVGNIYVDLETTWDSYPEDGTLVVFPSHIKHMAFPYTGEKDRVVVSFHAKIHSETALDFGYSFS